MIYESRVGKKHQTVVPSMIREMADIGEGDSLLWEVQGDGSILVRPQKSKTELLASLNKQIYGSYEQAQKHVREEQDSWG